MGLIIDLSGELRKPKPESDSFDAAIKAREATIPKQDPCPIAVPDPVPEGAELISSSLKYLAGITEDLSGWTLWKRIEQGKEHRFALDPAGVIRWKRWYAQTALELAK